jgi:hypothetical protein
MSFLKSTLAIATMALGLALSAPTPAAQIGGPVPIVDRDDPVGTWTAIVRWYQPRWINGVYYQYQYATITSSTYANCNAQLMSYTASPNVQVVQWCILS